jgi:deoxyhypusine synthase
MGEIAAFLKRHYRHFNSAVVVDAAEAYVRHLDSGGSMMVTLAGAMSTAELGCSLAEMIRQGKVHIISCTGANLEEDLFNLVAHDEYLRIPAYRELSAEDERELLERGLNRVTDTCIPEEAAMRALEARVLDRWLRAQANGESHLPHEYLFQVLREGVLATSYQIEPADSWVAAACEMNIPLIVPGWEDSTLGNMFASHCIRGRVRPGVVKSGVEYMVGLADWYATEAAQAEVGLFQIGGGIAGDFPICVVPMLTQDLKRDDIPVWSYFCQISDSTTSYGSYSGAVPNEKITWGKLGVETPRFIIESDASIVAPLVFAWVLGL